MKITDARNPRWLDAEKTRIAIEVQLDGEGVENWDKTKWVNYAASPSDTVEQGRRLFLGAKEGSYGPVQDAPEILYKKKELKEKKARADSLDLRLIRSLKARIDKTNTAKDDEIYDELSSDVLALRKEIGGLEKWIEENAPKKKEEK